MAPTARVSAISRDRCVTIIVKVFQMMKDPTNEAQSDLLEQLLKEGMLDKDGKGRLRLTPRAPHDNSWVVRGTEGAHAEWDDYLAPAA